MKSYPEKFKFSVSHTTRQMREGEKHGINYYFVETDKFLQVELFNT
jgi:guanylate kinase